MPSPIEVLKSLLPVAGSITLAKRRGPRVVLKQAVALVKRKTPEILTPTEYGIRLLAGHGVSAATHGALIEKINRQNERLDAQMSQYDAKPDPFYVSAIDGGWMTHNEIRFRLPRTEEYRPEPVTDAKLHAIIDNNNQRYFDLYLCAGASMPARRKQSRELDGLTHA
jgi:hypothetical protein